jgi:hypothetical protein
MKSFVSAVLIALAAVAFTAPAFAGDHTGYARGVAIAAAAADRHGW